MILFLVGFRIASALQVEANRLVVRVGVVKLAQNSE